MRHRLSGPSTYGLNGLDREMSTPPTLRRGMADFTLPFMSVSLTVNVICIANIQETRHPTRVTTGSGKSWEVLEFRKTIFEAWKISMMSWILWIFTTALRNSVMWSCWQLSLWFCLVDTLLVQAAGTVNTNSDMHIHKSCVVSLEKYVVPIGHDFHLLVTEKSWKILFERVVTLSCSCDWWKIWYFTR